MHVLISFENFRAGADFVRNGRKRHAEAYNFFIRFEKGYNGIKTLQEGLILYLFDCECVQSLRKKHVR